MEEVRLHIGGKQRLDGWKIVDIEDRPEVDIVSGGDDLSLFPCGSVSEVYASHVLEHMNWATAEHALSEWYRVLQPGGRLRVAVPDVLLLASLCSSPHVSTRGVYELFRMMFGGQMNEHDQHRSGFCEEILMQLLEQAGFVDIKRVASFGLLNDCSEVAFLGVPISLNLEARK